MSVTLGRRTYLLTFFTLGAYAPHLEALTLNTLLKHMESCVDIAVYCPQLKELFLNTVTDLTNSLLAALMRIAHLEVLKLTCCYNITGEVLSLTNTSWVCKLKHLELIYVMALTDSGFAAILQCCPELTHLTIRFAPLLTPLIMDAMTQHCVRLVDVLFTVTVCAGRVRRVVQNGDRPRGLLYSCIIMIIGFKYWIDGGGFCTYYILQHNCSVVCRNVIHAVCYVVGL